MVTAVVLPETAAAGPGGASCAYAEVLLAKVRAPLRAPLRAACDAVVDHARPWVCLEQGELDAHGRPCAAPATCFVSHAWENRFADLLAALEALDGAEDAYLWIGARAEDLATAHACAFR